MKCKDLGVEPCRFCKYLEHMCIVADLDYKFTWYPEQRKELLMISLVEGIYYGDNVPREDKAEVLRCYSALIKAKYKELEYLLVLV